MVGEHSRVSAVDAGVLGRAAEDLTPPRRHMRAMILVHATGKKRREHVVALDSVIEGVDQPPKRVRAARPLEQARWLIRG